MPQAIVDALLEPLGEAMRRRDFIRAIAYSTTAWPFTALAQQSGRSRLIGVLINNPESDPEMQASLVAFKQELERLNWLDGGNARFDIRFTEGDLDQMRRKRWLLCNPI